MNPDIIKSYILDTFSSIYHLPSSVNISYDRHTDADIVIKQGRLSFFETTQSLPEEFVWEMWNDQKIPFPLNTEKEEEIINVTDTQIIINYDIFAASFYFLSGWQEIHQTETDKFCRFPFESSFQYKHDLILTPLVNYYFDILKTAIEQKSGDTVYRLHSDAPLTAFLSHDIDQINDGWKNDIKHEIKKGNIPAALKILSRRAVKKDEWNNLDVIVELEKMLGVVSSFFILPNKTKHNADYEIKEIEGYFEMIEEAGSEVGVHGSLGAGMDGKQLKDEIARLNWEVTGNRYHFLQNNVKITPQILDDAGLAYDSSLCFDDWIGFRTGFCFPFRPFNFATQKPFKHFQIPLLVMDSTMEVEKFMGHLPYSEIKKSVDHIINEVETFGGVFTLLWHNSFFTNHKYEGWGQRYVQIVQELKNKKAEFLTGAEIATRYNS